MSRTASGTAGLIAIFLALAGCGQQPSTGPGDGKKPASAPAQPPPAPTTAPPTAQPAPAPAQKTEPAAPADAGKLRRVKALVSGRVQGVGFRAYTNAQANRIGVTGTVCNLKDGRVEAVIEGPSSKVEELLKVIRVGPSGSRVDGVEVEEQAHTGEFKEFRVTY
jgi:acylphosphatase